MPVPIGFQAISALQKSPPMGEGRSPHALINFQRGVASRLARADEGAHELAVDLRRDRVRRRCPWPARNWRASSDGVDARRLDVDPSKPAAVELRRVLRVVQSAPAMQPTHSSTFLRISAGISPRTTTSETAKRPPGFSTRNASRKHAVLVGRQIDHAVGDDHVHRVVRQRDVLDLALQELDVLDARPCAGSRARAPASRRSCRARRPCPSGPTRLADSSTSMPPPEPRSSTVSPGFSCASAVGLPQPSEACSACSGTSPLCCALYRFEVIGSQPLRPRQG